MGDYTFENKNVSKKRFIIIVEANQDLRSTVNIRSHKLGISQKEYISALILNDSVKNSLNDPQLKNSLDELEKSEILNDLNLLETKKRKLTEDEKFRLKKRIISYFKFFEKEDPQELFDFSNLLEKRKETWKKKNGIIDNPQEFFNDKFKDI